MYAIEIEFDTDASLHSKTAILPPYSQLERAAGMFNRLTLARALANEVPVTGGGKVYVLSARMYEVDATSALECITAVKSGSAHLIDEVSDALDDELDRYWG